MGRGVLKKKSADRKRKRKIRHTRFVAKKLAQMSIAQSDNRRAMPRNEGSSPQALVNSNGGKGPSGPKKKRERKRERKKGSIQPSRCKGRDRGIHEARSSMRPRPRPSPTFSLQRNPTLILKFPSNRHHTRFSSRHRILFKLREPSRR